MPSSPASPENVTWPEMSMKSGVVGRRVGGDPRAEHPRLSGERHLARDVDEIRSGGRRNGWNVLEHADDATLLDDEPAAGIVGRLEHRDRGAECKGGEHALNA